MCTLLEKSKSPFLYFHDLMFRIVYFCICGYLCNNIVTFGIKDFVFVFLLKL